jgi:hypothetical protein
MIIILVIALIIIGVVLYIYFRSTETNSVSGKLGDINDHLKKLMYSDEDGAFLSISISKTGDFIQFTGDRKGVQLDLPQITERQKELHTKFHTIAKEMGLVVIKNDGADGSQFLDINIHGDLTKVTDIVSKFIKQLYEIEEETDLIFTTN